MNNPSESHKNLIRRYYNDLWNRWDFLVADEIIAEGITFRGSLAITVQSRGSFLEYVNLVRSAFPDFHNHIEELICEGDTVVARLTYTGTHKGELFGVAPTGNKVAYAGVAIFHISNDQIAEGWVLGDTPSVLRQIGSYTLPSN